MSPKTRSGHRILELNEYSLAAIQAQRLLTYDANNPEALVFQNDRAKNNLKGWESDTFITQYDRIMKQLKVSKDIKRIDPYELRHSFASMLWNAGLISIENLSKMLGHADIEVTKEAYVVEIQSAIKTKAINGLLGTDLLEMPDNM